MGGKSSTTTQSVQIPKEVLDRYNSINARAESVAQTPFQQFGTQGSDFVAQLNNQQQAGIQNINSAAGSAQPYFQGATAATLGGMNQANAGDLNVQKYMNPFQQQVVDATMAQMGQANQQAQSGALGTAASSGAFGGDRAGIAAANLANQQGLAMGSTLAGLNAQNYSQALGAAQQQQGVNLSADQANLARLMSGGQQLGTLGAGAQAAGLQGAEAQINAGTLGQQTEQAGISALQNQFQQQQAYPFQVAQFLANIGMGTGALSGSTTETTQPSSFFSDRRLKEDIQRIGKSDDGLPIYKFKYKGDENHQTHVGFMADEVEQVKPDAVGVHPSGYKTVDYDRATKAGGGGVAGPYGAAVGSQPGSMGYVPDAYLPVGQLMTADPAALSNSQQSMAEQLAAAASFGENLNNLSDQYGTVKEKLQAWREKQHAQKQADSGKIGYASGGSAEYLRNAPDATGLKPEGQGDYMSGILANQGEDQAQRDLMKPNSNPNQPQSTVSKIGDAADTAMKIASLFLFNQGGAVGNRHGYATDGSVPMREEDIRRRRMLSGDMLPTAGVAPTRTSAILQGPDTGSDFGGVSGVPQIPSPPPSGVAPARQSVILQGPAAGSNFGSASNVQQIPSPPAGLSGPRIAEDTTAAPSQSGVLAPVLPAAHTAPKTPLGLGSAAVNTGEVSKDGYNPVVPYKTQLEFVSHELQKPEYSKYLRQDYASPAEAAIAFDSVYERSGGAGNDRAVAYANDVYSAAQSGDTSKLPPNAAEAYNHFVSTGMDPIKAAGATGRLMVESYPHMDPNARNTIGGGNGTYGIAQWRGPRMEELAGFAGIPLEAITSSPVSTPEGRYYSTGVAGASQTSERQQPQSSMSSPAIGGVKPYEDRNALGQMMYDKNGKVDRNALLSLLSGIGTMASSPSRYLGSAVLQGIGGAAGAYMGREQQVADIGAKNLENARQVAMDTMQWNELNGQNLTVAEYAKMAGLNMDLPQTATAQDIISGAYQPTTDSNLNKVDFNALQNGVVSIDGKDVRMQDDPNSLRRFINDNGFFAPDTPIGRQVAIAQNRLNEIEARGGITFDTNGNEVTLPAYVTAANTQAQNEANRQASISFRTTATERTPQVDQQLADTDKQVLLFTQLPAGSLTNEKTSAAAVLDALGMPAPDGMLADKAMAQEAIKLATSKMLTEMSGLPGGAPKAELDRLSQIAADPNLQPEAVKMILAMQKAALLQERDKYALRDQWNAENPNSSMDQLAYEQWFAKTHPFAAKYDEVKKDMPMFAGELGSAQKPHKVIDDSQFEANVPIGQYFVGPDGVTRQRRS